MLGLSSEQVTGKSTSGAIYTVAGGLFVNFYRFIRLSIATT